jgi:glycosyltransferase involved in cell wall biosynthesis
MSAPQVDILLATYNGERFLSRQLDSLFSQTYPNWHLYIRDDGSTDGTVAIIGKYAGKYPGQITFLGSENNGRGAMGNFSLLMGKSKAPYIAFCDQDDEWLPEKLAQSVSTLQELEHGRPEIPCFVFSDLEMIDDTGKVFAPSLWKHDGLDPRKISLSRLLVQNVPYGCAAMVNRSLLTLATPVDERALLHDHWMALLAAAAGKMAHIPQATIRHRIHTANASRTENPIEKQREKSMAALATGKNFYAYFALLQQQAVAVDERLNEHGISCAQRNGLVDFAHLRDKNKLLRMWLMLRHGYFKQSRLQTLKWMIRI